VKRVHGRVEPDADDNFFDICFTVKEHEKAHLTKAELFTIRSAFNHVDLRLGDRLDMLINGSTRAERIDQHRKIKASIPKSWTVKQRLLLRTAAIKLRTMLEEPTREQQARKRRLASKPWRKRVRGTYRRSKVSRS